MDEGFRTFDHTGDLGLEIRAATPARLFELAAIGLMAQIAAVPEPGPEAPIEAAVEIESEDGESLLVDWLNAVLLESELRRAFWTGVEVRSLGPDSIAARLRGVPRDRDRHRFLREVKAVSHHAAELDLDSGRCRARVVLDI